LALLGEDHTSRSDLRSIVATAWSWHLARSRPEGRRRETA
jgi:hypothetical protein